MVRRLQLLLLLACGCGEEWSPESIIEDLRVIGMKAEPAELKPGEAATLSALILDPTRVNQPVTVVWLGCDPDPFNLGRSACSDQAALANPEALFTGGKLPPGVSFIGLDDFATYPAKADVFSALPAGDARRLSGTVGQVLAIAVAEQTSGAPTMAELAALFERVRKKEVKSVITLFRIRISEAPACNTNPTIAAFKVAGELQRPGVRTRVFPGQKIEVGIEAPDTSFEPFTQVTPTAIEEKVEKLTSAWYSTSGRFNSLRVALRSEVKQFFTAPGSAEFPRDTIPPRRTGTFHVVMRDTRGGQDWVDHPFFICDIAAADPAVTRVTSPPARGEPVVLEGRNLEGILDVVVGGQALARGLFDAATGTWEALVPPAIAPGTYPLEVRGKGCRTLPSSLSLTVP